jgi:hypothetical protein
MTPEEANIQHRAIEAEFRPIEAQYQAALQHALNETSPNDVQSAQEAAFNAVPEEIRVQYFLAKRAFVESLEAIDRAYVVEAEGPPTTVDPPEEPV